MASASFQNTESNEGTRNHKDFNLRTINLLSAGMGGTIDLKPMMVELSYYEDIFSPTISGKLLISDTLGIIEQAHLHGNEYIRISFAKDSDDSSDLYIDKIFRIFSISDSSISNGSVGWLRENQLNKKVLNELSKLEKQQVSEPLTIAGGFLILKIEIRFVPLNRSSCIYLLIKTF